MPFDLKLQKVCSHEVFDELVSIEGLSPTFWSSLRHTTDGSTSFMEVRELGATEGLSNFIYERDGFTNWNLAPDNDQTIQWNTLGIGEGIASFIDGSTLINPAPELLVSYRCLPNDCPLCDGGEGTSKDIDFDIAGRLKTVTGNDKVRQRIFKAILTEIGTNEVHPNYGSTLHQTIGEKIDAFTEFTLQNSLQRAIQFLIEEQQNNPNLPLNEIVLGLRQVRVIQDPNDPRVLLAQIKVQTGDFKTIDVSFSMVSA